MESRCTIGAMASKKASASSPVICADGLRQRRRGERAGRDDHAVPLGRRQRHFLAHDLDQRMARRAPAVMAAEKPSRSTASAPPAGTWLASAARITSEFEPAHLLVQQADGVVLAIVGAERIGADQFGQAVGLVRLGAARRPHLVQHDRHAAAMRPARRPPSRPVRRRSRGWLASALATWTIPRRMGAARQWPRARIERKHWS